MADVTTRSRRAAGEHLRQTRRRLGWTLDDVVGRVTAEGLPFSRSTLHRIENGRAPLSFETVATLCRVMGVPFSHIQELISSAVARKNVDLTGWSFEDLVRRGNELGAAGDIALALAHFEAARDRVMLEERPQDRDVRLSRALIHVADCHRRLRHFGLSLEAATHVLNLEGSSHDDRARAVLLHVAVGYMTGDYYRARLFAEHAEALLNETSASVQAFGCYVIGNLHYKAGEYRLALERFEKAEPIYRSTGARLQLTRLEVTSGHALFLRGAQARGYRRVHRAYHRASRLRYEETALYALRTLGLMDAARQDVDSARFHFDRAAALARRLGLTHELFLSWHGIWEVARSVRDRQLEARARRVLRRLLKRVDHGVEEVEAFVATLTSERGKQK